MKKIVHLTSVHPIQDSRIFYKECLSLKEVGYDVSLIAQADEDSIIDGIKIKAIKKTQSRLKRMTVLLWQIYFKAIRENADLYHFHDPELILVGLLLRLHRKKVIYDVHEDVPRDILLKSWINPYVRKIIAFFFENFEKISTRSFQGIVTVTPKISNRFPKAKVVEVRNYPVLSNETPSEKTKSFKVCYAGLMTLQRGILEMVAASEKSNTPLLLAGSFNCKELKNKVLSSQVVQYLGYLNKDQIADFYNESSVGLSTLHSGPTFNDSLPIKIFEYMAAGIPVIASDFPLWRDIILKHDCGFCVGPLDTTLISEKIIYLKNNPDIAKAMGMKGRQAVEKFYNWSTEFVKLNDLYQRILA